MLIKLAMAARGLPLEYFTSNHDEFELDPPYQRSSVWTEDQRRALIKSLLLGLPIGSLVINHRGYQGEIIYAIIDGKQRIEALRAFVSDELTVPAEWFTEDALPGASTVFSELPRPHQRRFNNTTIPSLEAKVEGVAAEAELFLLLNVAGTTQTADDLSRAAAIASA